ncbi:tRNA uridine-5-carboxymethylaminomethyl(34) synthesis GTPase MnmE [Roseovarius phycicola]|uniref:tRNA modification GTPase MnmE n=1 Tax=Roseovarius phycicola TaxID=3080976 RepID=A0ABZ2HJP9_9RHOB
MDTIFALSTAQGKAGVSVVRVSGPDAYLAAKALCGGVPSPRKSSLRVLRTADGGRLDEALVLVFEETQSFTGEAVVEFQCHGSLAVISKLLETLGKMRNFRLAEPGEFTRRALENDRFDLPQVEGLADLIEAETETQRRQALRVFSGELGQKTERWRQRLIRAAALIEATIDFADEDVPVDVAPEVSGLLTSVQEDLEKEIDGYAAAERIRSGFEIAIVGPPNVGKSTLLNYLAGRDAAITSSHAGTTRDVIEVRMDLMGLPVTLLDTAGLRDTSDEVEALGIDRARRRADQADLRVILVEHGSEPELEPRAEDLVCVAKTDCLDQFSGRGVSGSTGAGVSELVREIGERLGNRVADGGLAIRERHRDALIRGNRSLRRAIISVSSGLENSELCSEDIRCTIRALDSLIGRVDIENVLDEIFASFCLGK